MSEEIIVKIEESTELEQKIEVTRSLCIYSWKYSIFCNQRFRINRSYVLIFIIIC